MIRSAKRGVSENLQPAGTTTGNGTVLATTRTVREHRFIITGSAGVATGAVQPETSNDPNYAGTWVALGSPITVVASSKLSVAVEGVLECVRARISTNITGGTVQVDYVAGQ